MGYRIPSKFNTSQRNEILSILNRFHSDNQAIESANKEIRQLNKNIKVRKHKVKLLKPSPGSAVIKELKSKGLYYDKNSIYYDIRSTGATFNASTPFKRARAQKWFDEYFEPLRKEKKLTAKQAYKVWQRAKKQSYENMTEMELEFALELREMGSP